MKYKYDQYNNYIALLPNGGEVDDQGNLHDAAGRLVYNIPYPRKEVRTPLTWETRVEARATPVTCYKLTGTHSMDYPSHVRVSADDGMIGPSMGGSRGQIVFIKDTYLVTVHHLVVVATNNLGEAAIFSPNIPSGDRLSYTTGYGTSNEYTLEAEPVVPTLPTEKVEYTRMERKELLKYFWDKGVQYFEANPYVPAPAKAPPPTINVGDTVHHPIHGAVVVRSTMGDSLAVHSPKSGVKIVMISSITI